MAYLDMLFDDLKFETVSVPVQVASNWETALEITGPGIIYGLEASLIQSKVSGNPDIATGNWRYEIDDVNGIYYSAIGTPYNGPYAFKVYTSLDGLDFLTAGRYLSSDSTPVAKAPFIFSSLFKLQYKLNKINNMSPISIRIAYQKGK